MNINPLFILFQYAIKKKNSSETEDQDPSLKGRLTRQKKTKEQMDNERRSSMVLDQEGEESEDEDLMTVLSRCCVIL